jgi:hypothetical protein
MESANSNSLIVTTEPLMSPEYCGCWAPTVASSEQHHFQLEFHAQLMQLQQVHDNQ